jgi:hypothetical protein
VQPEIPERQRCRSTSVWPRTQLPACAKVTFEYFPYSRPATAVGPQARFRDPARCRHHARGIIYSRKATVSTQNTQRSFRLSVSKPWGRCVGDSALRRRPPESERCTTARASSLQRGHTPATARALDAWGWEALGRSAERVPTWALEAASGGAGLGVETCTTYEARRGAGRTHGFPSGLLSGSEGGTGPPGPTAHTNGAYHYGNAKIRTTVAGKLRFNVLESPFRGSGVVCSQGRVLRIDSGTLPANPIQGLDLQAPSRTYMM